MLTINSFGDGVDEITHVLKKHGKLTPTALANAKKVFRGFLGTERTIQKAAEATIERIERDVAAVRKSEADSVADATSNAFDYPATPGQASAAATEALQVLGIRRELSRRIQAMVPEATAAEIENAINLRLTSYEGEDGITVSNSNAQLMASMRERGDESAWMDMSSPSQMERPGMDAEAVTDNFSGTRNGSYLNPPRSEMGATNFSGTGGASVAAGTNEGATVSDQKIQAIAQAAYAAGVAAGSSNFAKRAARRSR